MDVGNEVKGRNVTVDRAYGQYELAEELLDKFKLTVVSTICANRKGLPKHFRDTAGRQEGDYQVEGFILSSTFFQSHSNSDGKSYEH